MTDQIVKFEVTAIDLDGVSQGSFPGDKGKVNYWECPANVELENGKELTVTIRTYKNEDMRSIEPGVKLTGKVHTYQNTTRITLTKANATVAPQAAKEKPFDSGDNRSDEINGSVAFKGAIDICCASGTCDPKSIRAWTKELLKILKEAQTGRIPVADEKEPDDVPF